MSYRTEFDLPEIAEAEQLIARGFEDTSWHNDAAPSFTKNYGICRSLRVYIQEEKPEEREISGARFFVGEYLAESVEWIRDIADSDSFAEILAAIEAYKPSLSSSELVAENIYLDVLRAMQNAEEMQGPDLPEYETLMRAIIQECQTRIDNATGRA